VHWPPQQKSLGFAAHAPLVLQAPLTQWPLCGCPVVVLQIVDEPKIGSVVGAGRYDGLIGNFLGRSVPATGMSLGLERIIEVVRDSGDSWCTTCGELAAWVRSQAAA